MYCTTRDVKVIFCMPEFSCRKITLHRLHVDKNEDELGIGYDMIIAHDLMVKLGLSAVFKRQFLQLDGVTVPMKEPRGLLGKIDLNICKMSEVVMQNSKQVSTREVIESLVKIFYSAYVKTYI